jgi:hypothetical protein
LRESVQGEKVGAVAQGRHEGGHKGTIINVYMKLIVGAKGTMDGSLLAKAYHDTIDGGEKSWGKPSRQNLGKIWAKDRAGNAFLERACRGSNAEPTA